MLRKEMSPKAGSEIFSAQYTSLKGHSGSGLLEAGGGDSLVQIALASTNNTSISQRKYLPKINNIN